MEVFIFFLLVLASAILIYITPAVALAPNWIGDSNRIFAIPLLSVGVVYGVAKLLFAFGMWDPLIVRILLGAFLLIALTRVRRWKVETISGKSGVDWRVVLVLCVLLLPILAELATSPFDSDDENTSWNYWAKLAFLGKPADLFYTGAPYPQLLPLLLSSNYALLGDWSYQLVVKAGLWMISLSCFGLLAVFTIKKLGSISALVVLMVVVYFVDLRGEYRVAYADPLMATFLLAGFYFLYQDQVEESNLKNLWLASLFISLAALSKQAALPWAMVFFPALYAIREVGHLRELRFWGPMVTPILVGGVWLFSEGKGALSNEGVLQASMGDREVGEQLLAALFHYGKRPELVLTYFAFLVAIAWKLSWEKLVVALAIIISTGVWLILGGYQYRLGIHNFLLAWFFIIACIPKESISQFQKPTWQFIGRVFIAIVPILMVSSIAYSGLAANKKLRGTESISLLDGLSRQAWSFLGYEGADWISELKSSGSVKVLVFSNYLNGMFSPEINVVRMENQTPTASSVKLAKYIESEGVTHVVTLGNQMYAWGVGNVGLNRLVANCPERYQLLSEAKGNPIGLFIDFQAKLYRVVGDACGSS